VRAFTSLPLAGEVARCAGEGLDLLRDLGHHHVRVAQHVIIPEPQDFESPADEHVGADGVLPAMPRVVVLSAVEFDDQPDLETDEVREVGSDRKLPAEFSAKYLAIPQSRPQTAFGARLVATESARE
jgi:hypothetical protein